MGIYMGIHLDHTSKIFIEKSKVKYPKSGQFFGMVTIK